MIGPRKGEIGYFERSYGRIIVPAQNHNSRFAVCECEAERGHIRAADGTSRIFSGPPPRQWHDRLELTLQCEESELIKRSLEAVIKPRGDKVRLHYSSVTSTRVTVGNALYSSIRLSSAWAITGWLLAEQSGMAFPLGWSGRGNGIDWIMNNVAGELQKFSSMLREARMIEPENIPVVLAPSAAAVLLHEVIGHSAEAPFDSIARYSSLTGCRIASEVISVADDPLAPSGPVYYEYDDDNVRSIGPTSIVEQGVMVAQLHSHGSAEFTGGLSTANGRAATAWDLPIPRVSNLICEPGPFQEQELIENAGRGLYIHRLANGINNGATIEADIILAEQIKSGKRMGKFITGGRMCEEIGVLLRAAEVADNPSFNSNAICGKAGQLLFNVGACAPSIRLTAIGIIV